MNWRENTDDPRVAWMRQVENYYGAKYPASMAIKVLELLPQGTSFLKALFEELTDLHPAQYKQVPDKIIIKRAKLVVYEAYPEFRENSYQRIRDTEARLLEEDAGFNDGGAILHAALLAMKAGRNPRHDKAVQDLAKRNGVNIEDTPFGETG